MKRDVRLYIEDIWESIQRIEEYTHSIDKEEFLNNAQIQDAVVRRLEVIGEAVKNVPHGLKEKYQDIPWRRIAGMRDIVAHGYFGVRLDRIWRVIREDIPVLRNEIAKLREELEDAS